MEDKKYILVVNVPITGLIAAKSLERWQDGYFYILHDIETRIADQNGPATVTIREDGIGDGIYHVSFPDGIVEYKIIVDDL